MARISSNVNSRKSTIRYEMTRDFVAKYTAKFIPEFSNEDRVKMLEIFQIPDLKTCIVTGQKVAKTGGDHLFEVRGYYKKTGKVGIEQKWNRLPVTTGENKRYKKYEFIDENNKKYTKNIGYQKLTENELKMCDHGKKKLYNNIQKWIDHCDSRSVKLYVEMPTSPKKGMTHLSNHLHVLEGLSTLLSNIIRMP